MATQDTALSEDLLHSWLRFSLSVRTEKVLKELPFKEALVYDHLYKATEEDPECHITATQLCREFKMQKPQMTATLQRMEEKGYITRQRSSEDRRQVFVVLNESRISAFRAERAEVSRVLNEVIERYGAHRVPELIATFNELSDITEELLP